MSITIVELAKLAGCSDAAVSLVLNGKAKGRISKARQEHIFALAQKHAYRLNPAAKALVERRTSRVALCLDGPLAEHAIIGEFSLYVRLSCFCRGLHKAGYAVEIVEIDSSTSIEKVNRQLCMMAVDGFIFLHWSPQRIEDLLFSIEEKGIPTLASGTALSNENYTWTDIDVYGTFDQATRTLIEEGHRKVIFVDTILSVHADCFERGFQDAISEYLHEDGRKWLYRPKETSLKGIRELMESIAAQDGDARAFLISDNFYAEAILDCLEQRGIQPGKNCRIIGYGDTTLAERCKPRLSHFGLRVQEQVDFGLESLVQAIEHPEDFEPRQRKLMPQYIPGET